MSVSALHSYFQPQINLRRSSEQPIRKKTADFADLHRFSKKERTQGSGEKQKPQTLTACLSLYNHLLNKSLQQRHQKMTHKKQGNAGLYYEYFPDFN